MKTFLRMFLYFAIISWLGAELFFPVVAQITFTILAAQTHLAGAIVGACLEVVHHEAVVCAVLIALALVGARHQKMYPRPHIRGLLALVVLMLAFTALSEEVITPRMRAYREQAGGTIELASPDNQNRIAFERLHQYSEYTEMAIDLFGLAFVVVLAAAESKMRAPLISNLEVPS